MRKMKGKKRRETQKGARGGGGGNTLEGIAEGYQP